jgi:tetratricopeptide (TPR) repeat protein
MNAREIHAAVEELSQFKTICLCVTSRITTVPRLCKRLIIPTLSMETACEIFYSIYGDGEWSNIVSDLLQRLDFHALSITLLATTAAHNMWDYDRLAQEWGARRTQVLRTDYNESLAATVELSLASPMFCELGPDARDLLGVIAFFPRGINEKNLDWFFPTISERRNIFDKFCVLSLTYRRDGFTTMLAPLRDYLCPKDPTSSPLLCATKEFYLKRLSVRLNPGWPGYEEAQWIASEDVNVEHLLDVFTSIDGNSGNIWDACVNFMRHLYWHKSRLVMLGPKLEGLPDNHPSKPQCLFQLSRLFDAAGNPTEFKRLLIHTLRLWRDRRRDSRVAQTLGFLAEANTRLHLYAEGIPQAKESLEIFGRLNRIPEQAASLQRLAWLLYYDKQLDAAEETASRSINLLPDNSEQFTVCQGHRLLGNIYRSKGEAEKAIDHLNAALQIASSSNWQSALFWIHHSLAELFCGQAKFDETHTHVEHAKSHAANGTYNLGCAMELQTRVWFKQGRLEEAESEALRAVGVFEKLGFVTGVEGCRNTLRHIKEKMKEPVTSGESGVNGELLKTAPLPTPVNSSFSA